MNTTAEEARSDLFLAGAVYLFGPLVLQLAGDLFSVPILGDILLVVAPLLTTALVPFLLFRYRKERLRDYGLTGDRTAGLTAGALLALPLLAGAVLPPAVRGGVLAGTLPALVLDQTPLTLFLANVTTWFGLTVLAVYSGVKAREAFRADIRKVRDGTIEIARILGIALAIAVVLLIVGSASGTLPADPVLVALVPVGAAASVLLLLQRFLPPATTTRAALLTPVILLALRPFNPFAAFFSPGNFVVSIWSAALIGVIGLLMAATLEGRRSAWPAIALAGLLALFVPASFLAG